MKPYKDVLSGSGVYAGINICFTAYNVTESTRERYNETLAKEIMSVENIGHQIEASKARA